MARPSSQSERTRLMALLAILALVAVIAVFKGMGGDRGVGTAAKGNELSYERKNLPALLSSEVERVPEAAGTEHRNPFTYGKPPTPTPNLTPRPTPTPRVVSTRPPQPTATATPTGWKGPPPAFDRLYLGHFGPERLQVAAFRRKDAEEDGVKEVEVAVVGEVLADRNGQPVFIVREIGLESVVIGFVGYDPSEDSRVPVAED